MRRSERDSQTMGALRPPACEAEIRRSADGLSETSEKAHAPNPGSPAQDVDPSKEWLLEQLRRLEIASPIVYLYAKGKNAGKWQLKNGNQRLGMMTDDEVQRRDLEAFDREMRLRAAVTVRIVRAPWETLWTLARCMPHVQQEIIFGLMGKQNAGAVAETWAFRYSADALRDWQIERLKRVKTAKTEEMKARLRAEATITVASSLRRAASRRAVQMYTGWLARHRYERSMPWPHSAGFDVDAQEFRITSDGGYRISAQISLLGQIDGKNQEQPKIGISPKGPSAWATIRKILSGKYQTTGCRILNVDGKWLMKISYRMPRPQVLDGSSVLLVRRGMGKFLVGLGSDGRPMRTLESGQSIIAIKRQLDGRRNKARSALQHQGSGARGHGRARYYKTYTFLRDVEARFVDDWCKRQMMHVVRQAILGGYGTIIMERFSESKAPISRDPFLQKLLDKFPFAKLEQSLVWAATKGVYATPPPDGHPWPPRQGVKVRFQALDHKPDVCPACGEKGELDASDWFTCKCGFEALGDTVACWHHMHAAGVEFDPEAKAKTDRAARDELVRLRELRKRVRKAPASGEPWSEETKKRVRERKSRQHAEAQPGDTEE
jgi:hypothetical protein